MTTRVRRINDYIDGVQPQPWTATTFIFTCPFCDEVRGVGLQAAHQHLTTNHKERYEDAHHHQDIT